MTTKKTKKQKIQELLESKKKIKKRLEKVEAVFQEEKENEEFWPGHSSTRYQTADNERRVLLEHLSLIGSELKKLGHKG